MSSKPQIELIRELKVNDRDLEIGIPPLTPPTPSSANRIENLWDVGCCKLDKRCIMYFSQLAILTICIGTSLYQVSTKNDNRDFWISLLSTSCGVLLPSPRLKKD